MLRQRLITAAVLAPIAVGSILYSPSWVAGLMFGGFLAIGVQEWGKLVGLSTPMRWTWTAVFVVVASTLYWRAASVDIQTTVISIAAVTWLVIGVFVFHAQTTSQISLQSLVGRALRSSVCCLVILLGAFAAALNLLIEDPTLLILVFVAVWTADAAAYFV
ncbi:MAG: phosphatidate cytidylyltransferase, partial [Pseudomonadota bacterium]